MTFWISRFRYEIVNWSCLILCMYRINREFKLGFETTSRLVSTSRVHWQSQNCQTNCDWKAHFFEVSPFAPFYACHFGIYASKSPFWKPSTSPDSFLQVEYDFGLKLLFWLTSKIFTVWTISSLGPEIYKSKIGSTTQRVLLDSCER